MRRAILIFVLAATLRAFGGDFGRWKEIPLPVSFGQFAMMDFADSSHGLIVDHDGRYLLTSDGGITWKLDSLPWNVWQIWNALLFDSTSICIANSKWDTAGNREFLHFTTDGGSNWERVDLPEAAMHIDGRDVSLLNRNEFFFSARQDTACYLYQTHTGGITWDTLPLPKHEFSTPPISVHFVNSNTGFIAGGLCCPSWGFLERTTDGGKSWDDFLNLGESLCADDIVFYDSLRGMFSGVYASYDEMSYSPYTILANFRTGRYEHLAEHASYGILRDNGDVLLFDGLVRVVQEPGESTYVLRYGGSGYPFLAFETVDDQYAWILTADGHLFKRIGPETPVREIDDPAVPELVALHQNYPNPFNPTTTISYSLPSSMHVTLAIYDVMGRCVRILVDERQGSGSHAVTLEGSGLASGVYLYRLEAGERSITRKLMFLK